MITQKWKEFDLLRVFETPCLASPKPEEISVLDECLAL